MPLTRMIWFSNLMATVIYVVMAFMMAQRNASRPFEDALHSQFVMIIYGIALVIFLFAFFYPPFLPQQPPRVRMLVSLALFEACTILGLVLAFMNQDWRLILTPLALTLIGFFRAFPTGEPD